MKLHNKHIGLPNQILLGISFSFRCILIKFSWNSRDTSSDYSKLWHLSKREGSALLLLTWYHCWVCCLAVRRFWQPNQCYKSWQTQYCVSNYLNILPEYSWKQRRLESLQSLWPDHEAWKVFVWILSVRFMPKGAFGSSNTFGGWGRR